MKAGPRDLARLDRAFPCSERTWGLLRALAADVVAGRLDLDAAERRAVAL